MPGEVSTRSRYGGLSLRAYAATAILGGVAFALKGPTDGRSFGVLALAGAVAIADCIVYFRRPEVRAPKTSAAVEAPLNALAGMAAGVAFVVLGILAAVGIVRFA